MKAYLLVESLSRKKLPSILESVRKITGVVEANDVNGAYEMVCELSGSDQYAISNVVSAIREVKGISRTHTLVVLTWSYPHFVLVSVTILILKILEW